MQNFGVKIFNAKADQSKDAFLANDIVPLQHPRKVSPKPNMFGHFTFSKTVALLNRALSLIAGLLDLLPREVRKKTTNNSLEDPGD